jgi:hypothetical protein
MQPRAVPGYFTPSAQAGVAPVPSPFRQVHDNVTIFEGTSEIQRMIIGRAVTGLDVR